MQNRSVDQLIQVFEEKLKTTLKIDEKRFSKTENREIPSWSPNYERLKAKIKEKTETIKQIKLLDSLSNAEALDQKRQIKAIPEVTTSAVKSKPEPSQSSLWNSSGISSANFGFENDLKLLGAKMLQILETKPNAEDQLERKAPKRLKVKLLDHQYYAMNWLKWREATEPRGGILADDMGLGKFNWQCLLISDLRLPLALKAKHSRS